VPIDRKDDAYFAPLETLQLDGGRLYLGLVHNRDSLEDNLKRIEVARRHTKDFGISTECGFGGRPAESIPALLAWHAKIASAAGLT
jgi:hypothetical protein